MGLHDDRGVEKSDPSLKFEGLPRPCESPEPPPCASSKVVGVGEVWRIRKTPTGEAGATAMEPEAIRSLPNVEGEGEPMLPAVSPP